MTPVNKRFYGEEIGESCFTLELEIPRRNALGVAWYRRRRQKPRKQNKSHELRILSIRKNRSLVPEGEESRRQSPERRGGGNFSLRSQTTTGEIRTSCLRDANPAVLKSVFVGSQRAAWIL